MNLPPRATAAPGAARLEWLDLYRGAAVLAMIETHVVNTFLATSLQVNAIFWWTNYFNGLVAPAFLFIAGYALGLGLRRAAEPRRDFGKRTRRLAEIALLGYALHFPARELFGGKWHDVLRGWSQVDVLQCLAVCLFLLLVIECFAKPGAEFIVTALFATVVWLEAPSRGWIGLPIALQGWVNTSAGSLFPLFPWLAFACAGFLVNRARNAAWIAAAAAIALTFVLPGAPGFFFHRLAWVAGAIPLSELVARFFAPRAVVFAGRNSLVMYAAHLLLIEVLAGFIPRTACGVAAIVGIFITVLAMTYAVAVLWNFLRRPPQPR